MSFIRILNYYINASEILCIELVDDNIVVHYTNGQHNKFEFATTALATQYFSNLSLP